MAVQRPFSDLTHVLDTSAILAVFLGERGADLVIAAGRRGLISAVNVSEIIAKMLDRGAPHELIRTRLEKHGLTVAPFDEERAHKAGALRSATRDHNISLADRACIALALESKLPLFTGDTDWAELDLPLDVRLIR